MSASRHERDQNNNNNNTDVRNSWKPCFVIEIDARYLSRIINPMAFTFDGLCYFLFVVEFFLVIMFTPLSSPSQFYYNTSFLYFQLMTLWLFSRSFLMTFYVTLQGCIVSFHFAWLELLKNLRVKRAMKWRSLLRIDIHVLFLYSTSKSIHQKIEKESTRS